MFNFFATIKKAKPTHWYVSIWLAG